MKFEMVENTNSILENEYDELQGYLSSTINKLKETTVTLENISKSYDRFKNIVEKQFDNFLSCLDSEKIDDSTFRGTVENTEKFQHVFDELYYFDNVHIECDDIGTIYIHFLIDVNGDDKHAATIIIGSPDGDMWNTLRRRNLKENTRVTLSLTAQLDLEWAIYGYVSKMVKQL